MRRTRAAVLAALAAVVVLMVPGAATADDASPATLSNVVEVHNDTNGQTKGTASFVMQYSDKARTNVSQKVAATATCVGCNTIAIGVQVAIIDSPAPQLTVENSAFARNTHCGVCHTTAIAYQYVVVTPGELVLPERFNSALAKASQRIEVLRLSNLPPATIDSLVAQEAANVKTLLAHGAAAAGKPATVTMKRDVDLSGL